MTSAPITSTTAPVSGSSPRATSFSDTLASEWSKLFSLRSTYVTLGLGLLLSLATSAVVVLAIAGTQNELPDGMDPVTISMVGTIFGLIVYSVFGVVAASREYANGLIRLTLVATPSRSRVFFAKLLLVGATIVTLGVVTTVAMFYLGQAVLSANGLPTATLADRDAQRMVFGLGVAMAFFPTLGFGLGILLRSTAGGITTVLGLLWLPQIFGEFVPMWWREHVMSLLPSNAVDSMTVSHIQSNPSFPDPAFGAVIAAAWLLGIVGTAYAAFLRRDA